MSRGGSPLGRRRPALLLAGVLALALVGLSGCGKKPSAVDPPEGAAPGFPHTYPNPKYDPRPAGTPVPAPTERQQNTPAADTPFSERLVDPMGPPPLATQPRPVPLGP